MPGTILTHVASLTSTDALPQAVDLAERSGAALVGVGAEGFNAAWGQGYGLIEGSVMARLMEDLRARLAASRSRFVQATAGITDRSRLVVEEAMPRDAVVRHACAADWIVSARPSKNEDPSVCPSVSDLIIDSGLPVLLAPDGETTLSARRIVVGWKNTREARRALSAAMPLLAAAEDVVVVQVVPVATDRLDASLEETCRRLAGRGCAARPLRTERSDRQALREALVGS